MARILIIQVLVLLMAGCKAPKSNINSSKPFTDENLLDSLVSDWKADNMDYLKDLVSVAISENESKHLENLMIYTERSSKGYGQYESRRKNFLRYLFSNYVIDNEKFVLSENFQGEKTFYTVVFSDKKLTFQNLVEDWKEVKGEEVSSFENIANNIKNFHRDPDCPIRSFSFTLTTFFNQRNIVTILDDKSCQTGNILY